jgi:hypothetical protein
LIATIFDCSVVTLARAPRGGDKTERSRAIFITPAHARAFPLSFRNDALEFTLLGFNLPQSRVQPANSLFEPGNPHRDCPLLCVVPCGFGIPPVRSRFPRTRRTLSFDRIVASALRSLEATPHFRKLAPKRFAFQHRLLSLTPSFVALSKRLLATRLRQHRAAPLFGELSHGLFTLRASFVPLSYHHLTTIAQRLSFRFITNKTLTRKI